MQYQTIKLEQQENYAVLTLNRPKSLNSINTLMHQELRDAIKIIQTAKPRALMLTGAGRGFCSGQDLNDRSVSKHEQQIDLGDSLKLRYNPLVKSIYNLPFPTVCAVNGVAAGAGVSLALCCDFLLASENAKFIQSFSKIGLVPDSSITWLLPKLIGFARAKAVMMLGQAISAKQALDWGMIWQVLDADKLQTEALTMTKQLAAMPTQSLSMIKNAVLKSWNNTLEQQLKLEIDMQSFCGNTDDYQEGVSAFLEKREAKFIGY